MSSGVRVDVWLWAVRVFRTRTAATDACRAGKVRVNGTPAKAAQRIVAGDRVAARAAGRIVDLEVVEPISKRVGAARAAECHVDHSPPPVVTQSPDDAETLAGERERGAGRPTKRDRRRMDRFTGRG